MTQEKKLYKCIYCEGTGVVEEQGCAFCKGVGETEHDHTGEVCPVCGSAEENTIAKFEKAIIDQYVEEEEGG